MERVKKDLLRKHALEIRQHPKSLKVIINIFFVVIYLHIYITF